MMSNCSLPLKAVADKPSEALPAKRVLLNIDKSNK